MGDRTDCTLTLWGLTTADKFNAICEAISQEESWDVDEIREALPDGDVHFEEVDGGDLAHTIVQAIREAGLGYHWVWGQGAEYQTGFTVHDPRQPETYTCLTVNYDVHVPLDQVENVEFVASARRALELTAGSTNIPLIVADTSHELVEAIKERPELGAFYKASV